MAENLFASAKTHNSKFRLILSNFSINFFLATIWDTSFTKIKGINIFSPEYALEISSNH